MTDNPIAERFWEKISPEPNSGCWLWIGAQTQKGYGQFWDGSGLRMAHRFSYQHHVGPIPAGLQIDHLCRVRSCVNPQHMEPVTSYENSRRGNSWRKTDHCHRGHARTEDNTYIHPRDGSQVCKVCRKSWAGRTKPTTYTPEQGDGD